MDCDYFPIFCYDHFSHYFVRLMYFFPKKPHQNTPELFYYYRPFQGVFLPYFHPYYAQVTQAGIEDGYLNSKANIHIEKNDLTLNVDAELVNLLFRSYEEGDQLFGLKADEILSFLKDRSGRLKFQVVVRWNIADRSVRAKDVIRKSIERSLKNTVIGNVGNILANTLQKIGEKGLDKNTEDVSGAIKKIKELLKY